MAAVRAATLTALGDDKKVPEDHTKLKPDDFLKLFIEQMTHQNPNNPMDSGAILQQMSAIGSITTSNDMQKTLANLEKNIDYIMGSTQMLQASNIIGHSVEVASDTGVLDEKTGMQGSAFVKDAVSDVTVTIKDQDGKIVKTIHTGPTASGGLVDFNWDGKDEDGNACKAGDYKISASATVDGKETDVPTATSFKVNSVAMDADGNVILNTDEMGGVYMKDILKIL